MADTTWTLLAVPEDDWSDLRAFVAQRQRARGAAPYPAGRDIAASDTIVATVRRYAFAEQEAWPEVALARLAEGTSLTARRFAEVMDLCAAHPGEVFSTDQVAERTDLSVNQWRSACRKMGAHLKANYPDVPVWTREPYTGEPMWPLVTISGRNLKVHDQLYVGITEEQAVRWRRVR